MHEKIALKSYTLSVSSRTQRTSGENTSVTPAALPSIRTPLTSWCPESSVRPFRCLAACTPCPSQPALAAHPTSYAWKDTHNPQTPCTIIHTNTPPPTNTIWEPKPVRPRMAPRASEATVTTLTWTQPRPTCTLQRARRLITTTLPDNDSIGTPNGIQIEKTHTNLETQTHETCWVSGRAHLRTVKRSGHIYWREKCPRGALWWALWTRH